MRSILFTVVLLLLLPIAFGINVQADETDPPPDPGLGDGDEGDVEGDHPWGGNNIVINDRDDIYPRRESRSTLTFLKYVKLYLYTYYGLDFFDSATTEYTRSVSVTRFDAPDEFSYRSDSKNRSR